MSGQEPLDHTIIQQQLNTILKEVAILVDQVAPRRQNSSSQKGTPARKASVTAALYPRLKELRACAQAVGQPAMMKWWLKNYYSKRNTQDPKAAFKKIVARGLAGIPQSPEIHRYWDRMIEHFTGKEKAAEVQGGVRKETVTIAKLKVLLDRYDLLPPEQLQPVEKTLQTLTEQGLITATGITDEGREAVEAALAGFSASAYGEDTAGALCATP